jgi:hypothetical protein
MKAKLSKLHHKIKLVYSVVFGFILISCAATARRKIFSPSSTPAKNIWGQHIHGGASLSSPPDGILVTPDLDTNHYLLIFSEPIKQRWTWFGLFFPMIPAFWTEYQSMSYTGEDKITLGIYSNLNLQGRGEKPKVYLKIGSNKIYGSIFDEFRFSEMSQIMVGAFLNKENKKSWLRISPKEHYVIEFGLKNGEVEEYDIGFENIIRGDKTLWSGEIHFKKVWQKYEFFGP